VSTPDGCRPALGNGRRAHPTGKALLLVIVVTLAIVGLAAMSVLGSR